MGIHSPDLGVFLGPCDEECKQLSKNIVKIPLTHKIVLHILSPCKRKFSGETGLLDSILEGDPGIGKEVARADDHGKATADPSIVVKAGGNHTLA